MPAIPEPTPGKAKILLVDDHPLMRRGLAALIDSEPDLAVCAEAGNRHAALDAIARRAVDLVIVDLSLEGGEDGLDLVKALKVRSPSVPALVLSMHPEAHYGERASGPARAAISPRSSSARQYSPPSAACSPAGSISAKRSARIWRRVSSAATQTPGRRSRRSATASCRYSG